MKRLTFLDTGAVFALIDAGDRKHAEVRQAYSDPERHFLLHELILIEACSLVTKRLHKQAAVQMVNAILSSSRVEKAPVPRDLIDAGWTRCRRYADKDWDWIDCISFELMERRGIWEALSLDRHLAQAGFELVVRH